MKKILLGLFLAALFSVPASAATCSMSWFAYGYVPTSAQWQSCWNSKQDTLTYTPVNKAGDIMFGPLGMVASSTARSGFNIPQGTAPASPVNGDIWTTSAGLYAEINGATVGPLDDGGGTVTSVGLASPDSTLSLGGTNPVTSAGTMNVDLNLTKANTWVGAQTFTNSGLALLGSSTGKTTFTSANAGASNYTLTFPASTDTLVGRATTDTLTGKSISGSGNTLTNIPLSAFTNIGTTTTVLHGNASGSPTFGSVGINDVSASTGTGSFAFSTSPVFVTPTLGAASATSVNKVAITAPATSATLTIANGKTLTASNTLTLTGTDSSSVNFGTGGTVLYSGAGTIPLSNLSTQASDTVVANASGSTAIPTAVSIGSCSTSSSALTYDTSAHAFACNTAINASTLGAKTFASPGTIGSTTPSSGAFTTVSATSTITPSSTAGIVGTTTNDNANAGSVGESVSAELVQGSAVSTTTLANITSISLSPGNWMVSGTVCFQTSSTSTAALYQAGVSGGSATLGGVGSYSQLDVGSQFLGSQCLATPSLNLKTATTKTMYLIGRGGPLAGTSTGWGVINAWRIR